MHAWALDHRVHHKFSETNSDPHDARRGFWFSHVGWLVLTPHPAVEARRKAVDMSDLDSDPILLWQKRLVCSNICWLLCYRQLDWTTVERRLFETIRAGCVQIINFLGS